MRRALPAGIVGGTVALMFAASAAFVVRWVATPQDCATAELTGPGVRVFQAPGGCPLRPGDQVTAVDGRRLAELPPGGWTGIERLAGTDAEVTLVRDGAPLTVPVPLAAPDLTAVLAPAAPTLLVMGALLALALYLMVRRPGEPASLALLLATGGLLASTVTWVLGISPTAVTDPQLRWGYPVVNQLIYVLGWSGGLAFALVFPHRLLSRRWTLAVAAAPLLALLATAAAGAATATHLEWTGRLVAAGSMIAVAVLLAFVGLAVVRLRTTTDPLGRQQLRWVVGGAALSAGLGLAGWYLPEQLLGDFLLPAELMGLGALPMVAGLAVALLRYRLFDLDVVLNRSLVYGLLTVAVTALYLLVLAGLSQLLQSGPVPGAAVVGTAVVAVAVNPLRIALQRGINRLMYGYRDDPYAALSRLGQRLEAAAAHESVLAGAAADVRRALRLPYAQVALAVRGDPGPAHGLRPAAAESGSPPAGTELVEVPLRHGGEQLGVLRVAPRAPTEPLSAADLRLLRDLAQQIGGAARVVALLSDLRRSRERLVLAREEERRRLRRVLHDEIGPSVAALGLRAATAARRPDAERLREIQTVASAAAAQLRRLAYDLRPPVLDERGLLGAVRELADGDVNGDSDGGGNRLTVAAEGSLDGLPAAVEVAAYRIVAEAVANVHRHAAARSCTVTLRRTAAALEVAVRDDGVGLAPGYRPGVGVASMRERAAELGGECTVGAADGAGTVVRARLPAGGTG